MTASRWVGCPMGRHYRKIFHNNKRGFAGKCFPKDLGSYIEWCNVYGIDANLWKTVRNMNKRILREQGITEKESENITFKNPYNENNNNS